MSMKTRHVTIVGGGIVGICTALSLQDRGIHVRLIERGRSWSGNIFW